MMKVVEYHRAFYFLLEMDSEYYIDVNCSRGPVGFSVTVQLNGSEKMHYKNQGSDFSYNLAEVIMQKSDPMHPRNIQDKELLSLVHESIMQWRKQTGS